MGSIEKDKIIDVLDKFPWTELLSKMDGAKENEVHFAPSIEFENKNTRHGLCISIIDLDDFYIFYKRPKLVSMMFGLIKRMNKDFLSERSGQRIKDVKEAVQALITDDIKTLEARWG